MGITDSGDEKRLSFGVRFVCPRAIHAATRVEPAEGVPLKCTFLGAFDETEICTLPNNRS
jgi:hypothetical protein